MTNPREEIVKVARREVGVKELSKNQSPRIKAYWQAIGDQSGYDDRRPWCAAFAAYCVKKASDDSDLLNVAVHPDLQAVRLWPNWSAKNGVIMFKPHDSLYFPQAGDIVSFLPRLSHIGIVESFNGNIVNTIEGNTNPSGSREGDGVYRKKRDLDFCGLFFRVPCIAQIND